MPVTVNNETFTTHKLENGILQRSVIFPTIFIILVHDLGKETMDPSTVLTQYADDFAVWSLEKNTESTRK